MLRTSLFGPIAALLCVVPLSAGTVGWYNGNFDSVNGLSNEINTSITHARVYEDFIVPTGGWTVVGLFSNNLMNFTGVTQAQWEIRSGVSAGNGGSLIGGGTASATQTATGRSGFGYTEYTVEVGGLSIFLSPGTYWMNVAPVGFGSGLSYNSTTSGASAVGLPAGNNSNSFFYSTSSGFPSNFGSAATQVGGSGDFSNGVMIGSAEGVPEPGTIGLVLSSGLLLAFLRRRSR